MRYLYRGRRGTLLGRAALAARQVLPEYRHTDPDCVDPKLSNGELVADLSRVFGALYARGADPSKVDPHLEHPLDVFTRPNLSGGSGLF